MRYSFILAVALAAGLTGCTDTAVVQGPPPPPPTYAAEPPPPPPPPAPASAELSPLEELCAPIALYPDPVVSLLLPASTYPDQIQEAASYLQGGGDPAATGGMAWDDSVKGLSHYPSVVQWMGANANWTMQLGGSFAHSPAAVMDAIQDLRRRAQAAGTLINNTQQQVIVYQNTVQIEPAQPDVIYVPQYDPAVVYVQQPYGYNSAVFFGWSRPYQAGVWLSFGFDWRSHAVYTGDWYHYQQEHGGYGHPINYASVRIDNSRHDTTIVNNRVTNNVTINNYNARGWQPPRNAPPAPQQSRFAQPRVMAGAPRPPAQAVRIHSIEQARPGPRPAARPANNPSPNRAQTTTQHPNAQPRPNPQQRPDSNQQPAAKPQVKSEQRPQPKPQARPEQKPQPKPQTKPKPQPKKPAPKKTPPPEDKDKDKEQHPQE